MIMRTVFILLFVFTFSNTFSQSIDAQLVQAAYDGDEATFTSLLNQGANVNATDANGYPALIYACAYGYENIAKLLIEHHAKINTKYNEVYPIFAAVRNDNTSTIQMLLTAGAYLNVEDSAGYTPLMYAAQEGYTQTAEFLINKGADINAESNNGHTALSIAIQNDHQETVDMLLKHNPKKKGYDHKQHSPLNTAIYLNNNSYKKQMKKYGMHNSISLPKLDYVSVGAGGIISPYELLIDYQGAVHERSFNILIYGGYGMNKSQNYEFLMNDGKYYSAIEKYYAGINKNIKLLTIPQGKLGITIGLQTGLYNELNLKTRQKHYQYLYTYTGGVYYSGKVFGAKIYYNQIFNNDANIFKGQIGITASMKIYKFKNSAYQYADKTLWMI